MTPRAAQVVLLVACLVLLVLAFVARRHWRAAFGPLCLLASLCGGASTLTGAAS